MSIDPGWKPDPDFLARYSALEILGTGGMGAVFLARDLRLDRKVAIKFIRPGKISEDRQSLRRFTNEARFTAGLNHPSIVQVYDSGVTAGQAFIVYEFVRGKDLKALLKERAAPLEPSLVRAVGLSIAAALQHAHEHGVIHRDVKPQNVLLVEGWEERFQAGVEFGWAKLTDFGLAKKADDAATMMTRTGMVVGTPNYMAPEQIQAGKPDGRTDVYALGVLLYHCLAGPAERRCFLAFTRGPLPELAELAPEAGSELAATIMRAMAYDPEGRWATAGAMAEALRAVPSGSLAAVSGAISPPALPVASRGQDPLAETSLGSGSPSRPAFGPNRRRHRVAGALLFLAAVLFALVALRPRPEPEGIDVRAPQLSLEHDKGRMHLQWTSERPYGEQVRLRNARGLIARDESLERSEHALTLECPVQGEMKLSFGRKDAEVRASLLLPVGARWPGLVEVDRDDRLVWRLPWLVGGSPELRLLGGGGEVEIRRLSSSPPSLVVSASSFRVRSVAALRWSTMTLVLDPDLRKHAAMHVELLRPPLEGLEPANLALALARVLERRSDAVGWKGFAELLLQRDAMALLVFDDPQSGGVHWKDGVFGSVMRFLERNLPAMEAALTSQAVPFKARLRLHRAMRDLLITGRAVRSNRKLLLTKGIVGLARPTARFLRVLKRVEALSQAFAALTIERFRDAVPPLPVEGPTLAVAQPPSRNCSYFVACNVRWEGALARRAGVDPGEMHARSLDGAMPNSPYNLLGLSEFNRKLLMAGYVAAIERRGLASRLRQTGVLDGLLSHAVGLSLHRAPLPQLIPALLLKSQILAPTLKDALKRGDLSKDLMARAVQSLSREGRRVDEAGLVQAAEEALAEHWKVKEGDLRELFASASKDVMNYVLGFVNPNRSQPFFPLFFNRPRPDGARWIEINLQFHGLSHRHALLLDTAPQGGASMLFFDEEGQEENTLGEYLNGMEFRPGDPTTYEIAAPKGRLVRLRLRVPAELVGIGYQRWRLRLIECTPSMYFRYPMLLKIVVRAIP